MGNRVRPRARSTIATKGSQRGSSAASSTAATSSRDTLRRRRVNALTLWNLVGCSTLPVRKPRGNDRGALENVDKAARA